MPPEDDSVDETIKMAISLSDPVFTADHSNGDIETFLADKQKVHFEFCCSIDIAIV